MLKRFNLLILYNIPTYQYPFKRQNISITYCVTVGDSSKVLRGLVSNSKWALW